MERSTVIMHTTNFTCLGKYFARITAMRSVNVGNVLQKLASMFITLVFGLWVPLLSLCYASDERNVCGSSTNQTGRNIFSGIFINVISSSVICSTL
jgi:hypothetical protein